MTDKRVKYVILAKKKGKGHAVEEHTAYNERAKERIVENLQMDNYKVKVLTRKSFTEKSMDSILRMVNNF
jgi:reverse gyrase